MSDPHQNPVLKIIVDHLAPVLISEDGREQIDTEAAEENIHSQN